jgi:hypothetical protein
MVLFSLKVWKRDERVIDTMMSKTFQTVCSLKNEVCETIQLVIDPEKNTITINPEKCLTCRFLEEKIKKSVIILPGSPMPELYKKTPPFMIDFRLQIPRRTIETIQ